MQILRVSFFLDVRICVVVHSKIKPSRTELSITSALKSAKTRTNLCVSSISIFRGPHLVMCLGTVAYVNATCAVPVTIAVKPDRFRI